MFFKKSHWSKRSSRKVFIIALWDYILKLNHLKIICVHPTWTHDASGFTSITDLYSCSREIKTSPLSRTCVFSSVIHKSTNKIEKEVGRLQVITHVTFLILWNKTVLYVCEQINNVIFDVQDLLCCWVTSQIIWISLNLCWLENIFATPGRIIITIMNENQRRVLEWAILLAAQLYRTSPWCWPATPQKLWSWFYPDSG